MNSQPQTNIPASVPDELKELFEMGAAGKLWTLEFEYTMDSERKLFRWRNLSEKELMVKRTKMFSVGMTVPVGGEPGHWRIICPIDIIRVDLYRQSGYFSG
jgi:hypothetical protein